MKRLFFPFTCSFTSHLTRYQPLCSSGQERRRTTQGHVPLNPTVRTMTRININLPSHVVRQLFFALRRVGGVRRGPIRYHGHWTAPQRLRASWASCSPHRCQWGWLRLHLLLFAVSDRILVDAAGVQFVVAARLLRSHRVCRASPHLLAEAWTVPAQAMLRH